MNGGAQEAQEDDFRIYQIWGYTIYQHPQFATRIEGYTGINRDVESTGRLATKIIQNISIRYGRHQQKHMAVGYSGELHV